MEKAAAHLTPVTLELGGKSPCLVDRTANLELAAKRIAFGKFLNCGQTCVAPDYVYCDEAVREPLVEALGRAVAALYGERPLENPDYGRIVNRKHFDRLIGLIDPEKVAFGGERDEAALRIARRFSTARRFPTPAWARRSSARSCPCSLTARWTRRFPRSTPRPHPLALYFFSSDRAAQRRVMEEARFGGGCVNDTIIHLATSNLPFGGVGESGMGGYHGAPASRRSPTARASWTRRRGSTCRCAIRLTRSAASG